MLLTLSRDEESMGKCLFRIDEGIVSVGSLGSGTIGEAIGHCTGIWGPWPSNRASGTRAATGGNAGWIHISRMLYHLAPTYPLVSVTNDCGRRRPIVAQRRMPLSSIHQNTCDDTASVAI